jgi:hypothetical protein
VFLNLVTVLLLGKKVAKYQAGDEGPPIFPSGSGGAMLQAGRLWEAVWISIS